MRGPLLILALLLPPALAAAQSGILLSGGGQSSDSSLTAQATIGQTGAAVVSDGDRLQLLGGFAFLATPTRIDSSIIRIAADPRLLVGATAVGDTTVHHLRIRNDGFASVSLAVSSSDPSFLPPTEQIIIEARATLVIEIFFAPISMGEAVATLSVAAPDDVELLTVRLSGYGGILPVGPLTIDFGLGPGDQGVRQVGGASAGATFTAELHAAAPTMFDGWSLVADLPPGLRYVADSFAPSALIPGIVVGADLHQAQVRLVGSAAVGAGRSRRGLLGTFQIQVTSSFADSALLAISEVALDVAGVTGLKERVRSTAVITARPSDALPGDFDEDGMVGMDDFFLFADAFHEQILRFDLNADDVVNFRDFFIFTDLFGTRREA